MEMMLSPKFEGKKLSKVSALVHVLYKGRTRIKPLHTEGYLYRLLA